MKKIMIFAVLVLAILAFGCAKPATLPDEPTPIDVPKLDQEKPALADEPETEKPAEEKAATEVKTASEDTELIGTRANGEEAPAVVDEKSTGNYEVLLLPTKLMDATALTIKASETISFKNTDTWPHEILIEQNNTEADNPWQKTILIMEGDRLEAGEVWTYTFDTEGVYLARDRFSGKMRMLVTVE